MSSGIKGSNNRPKLSKNLRTSSSKKRFKNASEGQAKYHAAIQARRAKKKKK